MLLPRFTNGALTEPEPFDPADPDIPAFQGWMGQEAGSYVSELFPQHMNDLTGEVFRLQGTGLASTDASRDYLAQIFRSASIPSKDVLPIINQVAAADVVSQFGFYKRVGQWVDMHVLVTWANTDALLDAEPMQFHLPYEAGLESVGRLSITQSNFRVNNSGGSYAAYEPVILSPPSVLTTMYVNGGLGQASAPVPIGDSVADGGNRIALFNIRYQTTGTRNLTWPYIDWYSITHKPINPGPTIVQYRYDGAQNGDLVELLTFPGLVVKDSHNIAAPAVPSGLGQFVIAAADSYVVRLQGSFLSRNAFTVDAI